MAGKDSYEEQQKRLQALFDETSTPESSQDPYADVDGLYGTDSDYQPSNYESSDSDYMDRNSQPRRSKNTDVTLLAEAKSSSSDDTDDDRTSCSSGLENQLVVTLTAEVHAQASMSASSSHEPLNSSTVMPSVSYEHVSAAPISSPIVELADNENHADISQEASLQTNVTNVHPRRVDVIVPEESWSETVAPIPNFNFDSSECGITVDVSAMEHPLDFFSLIFPNNFIDYLVNCTNAYGNALCNTNKPHTRFSRKTVYRETNYDEMKMFLGLSLLKGHVKCPTQRNLFSLSNGLYYHPIFTYIMSGRRYEQILRCLCASELSAKKDDKIVKFIDMLTLNFRKIYKAGEHLSLDESLLLFRGRLHFRQYIKSKKARYGIKFYELTTNDGYVLNIKMYSGKEDDTTLRLERDKTNKTEKIVMKLMRPYLLHGHHLVMDNYYNSVELSQKLIDLKTHSTGTLRSDRKGNPKYVMQKKLKKGEHIWVRKLNVYISKWHDKRDVRIITTKVHPKMVEVRNRFGKSRQKPAEVELYNKYMSGIDRSDQMVSYYSCPRKTIRWYKKVIFHLLDIATWNAYYLFKKYKKNNAATYRFINYRDELISAMIGLDHKLKGKDLVSGNSIHDNRRFKPSGSREENISGTESTFSGHWPEQMPSRPGTKKKFAFLKCKVCTQKQIRRETSYRCKGCSDKPPLCPSCFEEYHLNL